MLDGLCISSARRAGARQNARRTHARARGGERRDLLSGVAAVAPVPSLMARASQRRGSVYNSAYRPKEHRPPLTAAPAPRASARAAPAAAARALSAGAAAGPPGARQSGARSGRTSGRRSAGRCARPRGGTPFRFFGWCCDERRRRGGEERRGGVCVLRRGRRGRLGQRREGWPLWPSSLAPDCQRARAVRAPSSRSRALVLPDLEGGGPPDCAACSAVIKRVSPLHPPPAPITPCLAPPLPRSTPPQAHLPQQPPVLSVEAELRARDRQSGHRQAGLHELERLERELAEDLCL